MTKAFAKTIQEMSEFVLVRSICRPIALQEQVPMTSMTVPGENAAQTLTMHLIQTGLLLFAGRECPVQFAGIVYARRSHSSTKQTKQFDDRH